MLWLRLWLRHLRLFAVNGLRNSHGNTVDDRGHAPDVSSRRRRSSSFHVSLTCSVDIFPCELRLHLWWPHLLVHLHLLRLFLWHLSHRVSLFNEITGAALAQDFFREDAALPVNTDHLAERVLAGVAMELARCHSVAHWQLNL